jgi:protein-L-isoaspartate(D-aspartate) O-methyltransferase
MSFEAVRNQMIQQQMRTWDVLDTAVLEIFERLPREAFVPREYVDVAYADTQIPLGSGNFMLTPKIAGRILQAVRPRAGERVLEIGTGSGYLTAALAANGSEVRSLERRADLATHAASTLAALAIGNARVEHRDAFSPEALGSGTHDVIVLTASLPCEDERFERQLAIGGRLLVVVGRAPVMTAMLVERIGERDFRRTELFETQLEPMVGANGPSGFEF